jgi:hypothetical protein
MTVTEHVLPDAVLPPRVHTAVRVGAGQLCTGQATENEKRTSNYHFMTLCVHQLMAAGGWGVCWGGNDAVYV